MTMKRRGYKKLTAWLGLAALLAAMFVVLSCGGDDNVLPPVNPPVDPPPDAPPAAKPASLSSPARIADAGGGTLAVTDFSEGRVFFLNSETLEEAGRINGPGNPLGIAVVANTVFVGNAAKGAGNVNAFTRNGKYLYTLGSDVGYGLVKMPSDIGVDEAADRVFVFDAHEKNIKVYMLNGASVMEFPAPGVLHYPSAIAVDAVNDRVYIADYWEFTLFGTAEARIHVYDYFGALQDTISSASITGAEYQFSRPQGLALDLSGNLLVTEIILHKIIVLNTATKQGMRTLAPVSNTPGTYFAPGDVLVDGDGDVFVTESRNRRITVFRGEGL
jgi:DNA-binding beta-propeller fold protein YncE